MKDATRRTRPSAKLDFIALGGLPGLWLFYEVTLDAFRNQQWVNGVVCAFATLNTTYFCATAIWNWWTIPREAEDN